MYAVHHRSEAGEWDSYTRPPDPYLRGFVRGYEGYVEYRLGFRRRLEVPFPNVVLIVNIGPPFEVITPAGASRIVRHGSFVAGLHDRFALVASDAPAQCLQINLSPIAARMILDVPMHEIANQTVTLDDALGSQAHVLTERVRAATGWSDRFDLLDEFLLEKLSHARIPPAAVLYAWRSLLRSGGCTDVHDLAESCNWSNKHLIAQCRDYLGLPPKMLARVLRFSRAVRRLTRTSDAGWAAVALGCGYYDQSHLIRDFRRFAGTTPSDFLQRRIPNSGGYVGDSIAVPHG
jgi:AraC-like DNA-binding protein